MVEKRITEVRREGKGGREGGREEDIKDRGRTADDTEKSTPGKKHIRKI